jgi:ABC-2 type transport system ATP-binding protein
MNAISVRSLCKRYFKVTALDDVSFDVPQGAIYGLIGPNGAGKTTALKLLMNLQEPTSGSAQVLGIDSRRLRGEHFAQIGYVSENQRLPGWMTVKYLFDHLRPLYPTWDQARADELVAQFRLPLDRPIGKLSRGMQMKTALASSLCYRPKLVVLDEPFSGLDALMREELVTALLDGAEGAAVIISSHDLNEIESFVSHVGYLSDGRLQISEELGSLTARFREVVVTCADTTLPSPWPAHWICAERSSSAVRFVETQFDAERTPREINVFFRDVTHIETTPMSLKSIFVTLARNGTQAIERSAA